MTIFCACAYVISACDFPFPDQNKHGDSRRERGRETESMGARWSRREIVPERDGARGGLYKYPPPDGERSSVSANSTL